MSRKQIRWLMSRLAILTLLLVSGCFTSDKPLLDAGDTPLPATFRLASIDGAGKLIVDRDGAGDFIDFKQSGLSYTASGKGGDLILTVRMWDSAARLYAAQLIMGSKIYYGLMTLENGILTAYVPDASKGPQILAALKDAGVSFTEAAGIISFATRDQLYDGLRVLSRHMADAAVLRYQVASTPEQMS